MAGSVVWSTVRVFDPQTWFSRRGFSSLNFGSASFESPSTCQVLGDLPWQIDGDLPWQTRSGDLPWQTKFAMANRFAMANLEF